MHFIFAADPFLAKLLRFLLQPTAHLNQESLEKKPTWTWRKCGRFR